MCDIILHREKSKYWKLFIEGKMNRCVNIINPIDKKIHNVKLNIKFKYQKKNILIFDITMEYIEEINIENESTVKTHELCCVMKSVKNIVKTIEIENNCNQEYTNGLKDLLQEIERLCSDPNRKYYAENIYKLDCEDKNKLFEDILKSIYPNISFKWLISTSLGITKSVKDNLLDSIKTLCNNNHTHIENLYLLATETNKQDKIIQIKIIANNDIKLIPKEQSQYSNPYELFNLFDLFDLFEFNNFKNDQFYDNLNNQSHCQIIHLCDNFYQIEIEGFEIQNEFVLKSHQVKLLSGLKNNCKKKILLIDDSIMNLKLLSVNIIKFFDNNYKHKSFPVLTQEEWQNLGILVTETFDTNYILCANGMYGKEVALMIRPPIIISDIQMPLLNGIDMVKQLLENNFKSKIFMNSAYVKKTDDSDEIFDFIRENNIYFIEKGSNNDWMKNLYE